MGNIVEKKEVTEYKEVIIGYECDVCKKIELSTCEPNDWHSFSHHHNQWGNDSIDSYEYHLVCSLVFYSKKFNECVDDLKECYDAKIDNFEIAFARKLNILLSKASQ